METLIRDWLAYNEARTSEKRVFLDILSELCSYFSEEDKGKVGRSRARLSDMVFACVSKVYKAA